MSSRGFLALFLTQALGALNDNLFKNALVVLVVFRQIGGAPVLVAAAGGLFILPYLLLSASAGQLADRFCKARLVVLTKWAELVLMVLAAVGLLAGNVTLLFLVLFGLGAQAAFFSPLKYGILPELLPPDRLLRGNGLVEAATFVAILLGTIAGGIGIGSPRGPALIAGSGLAIAVAGLLAARRIPPGPAADPTLRLDRDPASATRRLLRTARAQPRIWVLLLALSWFWAFGAIFLAQFPVLVQRQFHGDNQVVTLLLASFSVGVGLGALVAGRQGRGADGRRLVVPAGAGMSLCAVAFIALALLPAAATWRCPAAMLLSPPGLAALLALLGTAACGGAYSVPLYAALQHRAGPTERARTIAANNVMNALFMVTAAVAIALLAAAGLGPLAILAVAAAVNLAVVLGLVAVAPALRDEHV